MKHFFNKYLIFFLLTNIIISFFFITNKLPSGDDLQNINIAYNINKNNGYSITTENNIIEKTNIREPVYPYIISILLNATNFNESLECLIKEKKCENTRYLIKYINIFFFLIIILFSYKISRLFNLSKIGSIFFLFLISFSNYFGHLDRYLSELISTAMLIANVYLIYKIINSYKKRYILILCLTFSLLILTKQVYLYWFYFIIIILSLLCFFKLKKIELTKILIVLSLTLIFISPWQYRNLVNFGNYEISGGGRAEANVAVRAYFNTINIKEYLTGFIYYIPGIGSKITEDLKLDKYTKRLNNKNEESFYIKGLPFILNIIDNDLLENSINITNFSNSLIVRENSKRIILESMKFSINNFLSHLYNIPLLTYRSLFINHSDSVLYRFENSFFKKITYIYLIIFNIPIFYIFLAFRKYKYDYIKDSFVLFLPIIFSVFFYSNISNYLPRFNMHLYPFFYLIFIQLIDTKFSR